MKKNDFILLYILLILILAASKIPTAKEAVEKIGFSENVLFLEENEEYRIPLTYNGKDSEIVFSYSNEGIVYIEEKTISAINVGHTTITATLAENETVVASIDVYVINTPELTSTKNEIKVNETIEITFSNSEQVGATRGDFDWTVSDETIATIDENYKLKGLKDGTVTITATYKLDPTIVSYYEIKVNTPKVDYANKLVNIALGQEGYVEADNGYTKYGAWYGLTYDEWCAMFVSWSANQAGIPTTVIPKFASVKTGKAFFEDQGLFQYKSGYTPKKGDIIFFLNGISHAAIVTKVENGRVYTIEGNTAEKVAQRSYSLTDSSITGYGTPNYKIIN